ncbi:hypothetical protein HDG35_005694 [Paraburkholderia sp. JPY681]|uniref:Uncharacterized protein n=1 Tax=Paraburkholderia atlantica TaxID=2654982 RepID=D5WM86_PARAM|nr:hypothetical protein BC1002_6489 [Paraburkholderia atlantica]MBB5509399.1 hypothetical protein [Paraburkholderia atlantica]
MSYRTFQCAEIRHHHGGGQQLPAAAGKRRYVPLPPLTTASYP